MRHLEAQSQPIANLAHITYMAAGGKSWESEWVNTPELIRKVREAKLEIPANAARIFLKLERQGKVPLWVQSCVNHRFIELAAM